MWAASTTFRAGDYLVGVRSSSGKVDALLRQVFLDHVARDDAPAAYSVWVNDARPRPGMPAARHAVYHGNRAAVADTCLQRVVRALWFHLAAHADERRPDRVQLTAGAVIGQGRAVLVPSGALQRRPGLDARLRHKGAVGLDVPWVTLDAARGEVVVDPAAVDFDGAALAQLAPPPLPRATVMPGRYPVAGWLVTDAAAAASRGAAALRAVRDVHDEPTVGWQRALEAVGAGLRTAAVHVMPDESPVLADLISQLLRDEAKWPGTGRG